MAHDDLNEKWGKPTKVSAAEKGKYEGKTKAELLKSYNALKKSGPHKKGTTEYGRMRELAFAIRAKSGWGKVESTQDTDHALEEKRKGPRSPYAVGMAQAMHQTGDKPPLKKSTITKGHEIARAIMRKESIEDNIQEAVDQEYQETLAALRKLAGL